MQKTIYSVSEAVRFLDIQSHVLRYWEEELRLPIGRNEMGHRYYTRWDIQIFMSIRELKKKGYALKEIGELTTLFYKNQVDEKDPPQRSTLISVSVGYHLDLMMTQALLYSLGLGFNRFSKRDYAYTFLLTRCRGKNIDECNAILEKLGIEQKYWLGSYAKRPRTK